jgi:hypothetical protein
MLKAATAIFNAISTQAMFAMAVIATVISVLAVLFSMLLEGPESPIEAAEPIVQQGSFPM